MLTAVTDASKPYQAAVNDAKARGVAVAAPDLKGFVRRAMRSIANAYVTAAMLECLAGGLLTTLNVGWGAMNAIADVAKAAANLAAAVAQGAANVAKGVWDLASILSKLLPVAIVGVVGYVGYRYARRAIRHHEQKALAPGEG